MGKIADKIYNFFGIKKSMKKKNPNTFEFQVNKILEDVGSDISKHIESIKDTGVANSDQETIRYCNEVVDRFNLIYSKKVQSEIKTLLFGKVELGKKNLITGKSRSIKKLGVVDKFSREYEKILAPDIIEQSTLRKLLGIKGKHYSIESVLIDYADQIKDLEEVGNTFLTKENNSIEIENYKKARQKIIDKIAEYKTDLELGYSVEELFNIAFYGKGYEGKL
ncbi:MAG: hypothetical protein LBM13_05750 [Candidatus Ancillula sp.]|jgi:DNA polymerase/3'-5' exonuclease PolX|nr:hypothetical protein [Candidatus Ancillula sp.]